MYLKDYVGAMNSKTIIKKYFDGWVRDDKDKVRFYLADGLKFRSPEENYDSADSFIEACWKHAEKMPRFDVIHEVYDNDGGYVVYSTGGFVSAELLKIRNGKIYEIYVTFHPTH